MLVCGRQGEISEMIFWYISPAPKRRQMVLSGAIHLYSVFFLPLRVYHVVLSIASLSGS